MEDAPGWSEPPPSQTLPRGSAQAIFNEAVPRVLRPDIQEPHLPVRELRRAVHTHGHKGPPPNGLLSRSYSVETTDEILATVELTTSRVNVAFRLSVLDQGKEVLSKTGIGQVIIPMFRFLASKGERSAVRLGRFYFYAVELRWRTTSFRGSFSSNIEIGFFMETRRDQIIIIQGLSFFLATLACCSV